MPKPAPPGDPLVLARMKARLAPWLNEPYFEVVHTYMKGNTCTHVDKGVRLDEVDRRCYCRGCGIMLDPFEALLYHARSEARLVQTWENIRKNQEAEERKRARDKARRPHVQDVVSRTATFSDGADTVIAGYDLRLACGHIQHWDNPHRVPRRVTCQQCVAAAAPKPRR